MQKAAARAWTKDLAAPPAASGGWAACVCRAYRWPDAADGRHTHALNAPGVSVPSPSQQRLGLRCRRRGQVQAGRATCHTGPAPPHPPHRDTAPGAARVASLAAPIDPVPAAVSARAGARATPFRKWVSKNRGPVSPVRAHSSASRRRFGSRRHAPGRPINKRIPITSLAFFLHWARLYVFNITVFSVVKCNTRSMQKTPHPARLLSAASVLGSRPGSVAVRVSGCPGAAWVWNMAHPSAARTLALRIPATAPDPAAVAQASAATVARHYGLRVSVRRAPCGAYWLKCSGHPASQHAAAAYWAGVLSMHARSVGAARTRASA